MLNKNFHSEKVTKQYTVLLEPFLRRYELLNHSKCIIFDSKYFQTPTVSCAFAQSEVMQKEVYIFDRIENKTSSENIKNLKCIVFVRPTAQNIERLVKELQDPRFSQYYLCKYLFLNKHYPNTIIFQISPTL